MSLSAVLSEAILSARSDAVIVADRNGIIDFWIPGAERILAILATTRSAAHSIWLFPSGCDSGIGGISTNHGEWKKPLWRGRCALGSGAP